MSHKSSLLIGVLGFFVIFPIVGLYALAFTTNRPTYPTKSLPKATLNQPYHANIYIGGGHVCNLSALISTDDILVLPRIYEMRHQTHTIDNAMPNTDYSKLTVTGTPTSTKPIKIKLLGFTCGTMFAGADINKEYTIEVVK